MVSASEVKVELPEIMSKKMTKVIVKNNTPVSVIMPYDEYVAMNENLDEGQRQLAKVGQDITLNNGVQIMVVPEVGVSKFSPDDISIKLYIKMKTSGDYKLHHTFSISPPSKEQSLTTEEMLKYYRGELEI